MKERKSIITDRKRSDPILERILEIIPEWLTPNILTAVSLALAIIYSLIVWLTGINDFSPGLFIAFLFLSFSALLDAVDGALARARKMESKWGDYLDHALDRVADVSFIVAIAFGGYICWEIALFAFVGIFLTSDFGVLAKAAGLKREYGGIMGRGIRLAILIIATLLNAIYPEKLGINEASFSFLGWAMAVIAIGGIFTAGQRFYRTRKALSG